MCPNFWVIIRKSKYKIEYISGETSIDHYEFMGRYRKMLGHFDFIDEATEEVSNSAYIATHTRITLKLKMLDELSFGTLRPMSQLLPFVESLQSSTSGSGTAWIHGLTGKFAL